MTDYEVDKLLSTTIPGGSQARDWFLPHDTEQGLKNVRDVVRRMFAAKNQYCEPVAWTDENFTTLYVSKDIAEIERANVELYTAPPKREPLTLEQIAKALASAALIPEDYREDGQIEPLVRAIEAAHGVGGQL